MGRKIHISSKGKSNRAPVWSETLTLFSSSSDSPYLDMTNTVQTTSKTTIVTRDATVRSVAGMGWTVLLTGQKTWQRVPWSLWC